MAIYTSVAQIPKLIRPVITIGSFDGVHMGHQTILNKVRARAAEVDGESLLVTFEPHPRKYLFPDKPLQLLTPLQEKLPLLQRCGMEHVLVVNFNAHIANMSAQNYVEELLVKYIQPHTIIVGYDHRYGKDRAGGLELLESLSSLFGFVVEEIPARLIDDAAVSSTKIRKALLDGELEHVKDMLGRTYSFKGRVVHGKKLGRQLGYPTANLRLSNHDQLLPAKGVYAVQANLNGHWINGMMNMGYRPTVELPNQLHIEVHFFDFNKDIYGELPEIHLVQYLRPEQKFENLEALKLQLQQDELAARKALL